MRPVRLHYATPSHYCEKARAILAYKRIPFDIAHVPYGDHTGVIRVSGQDYIPYVEVPGGKGVVWSDIPDWAESVAPEPTLYPGDDKRDSRARARLFEHWAHNVVEEMVWRYVVSDVPATLKDGRERWVFVEMQERKRGPLEVMAHRKPEFLAGVKEVCALAEDVLGDRRFLRGDAPGLADFALYGALHPLKLTGHPIPVESRRLAAWHARIDALARA